MAPFYSILLWPLLDDHVQSGLQQIKKVWSGFRENDKVFRIQCTGGEERELWTFITGKKS